MDQKSQPSMKELRQELAKLSISDYADRIRVMLEIIKLNPKSYDIWKDMGEIFFIEEFFPEAVTAYQNYLVGNKKDDKVWDRLARIHLLMEDYPQAISCAKNACSLNPKNLKAISTLDVAYLSNGDKFLADELIQDMQRRFPENEDVLFNYAVHLGGCGKWGECKQVFGNICASASNGNWILVAEIISVYKDWKNYNEMLFLCEIAERSFAYQPYFKYLHGIALMETGNFDVALEKFKSCHDPPMADKIAINIGEIYTRRGDYELAISSLKQFIRQSKNHMGAQKLLNELEQEIATGKITQRTQKAKEQMKKDQISNEDIQVLGDIPLHGTNAGWTLRIFTRPEKENKMSDSSSQSPAANESGNLTSSPNELQVLNHQDPKKKLFNEIESVRGRIREIDNALPTANNSIALREHKAVLRQKLRELQENYDRLS